MNGSEPVRAGTLDRFARAFAVAGLRRETLRPCYGLAECTLAVTMGEPQSPIVIRRYDRADLARGVAAPLAGATDAIELVGCGKPTETVTLHIVDPDDGTILGERRVGEIWVESPSNGLGYWNRPVESREVFAAVPAGLDGRHRCVRTGDLGFLDGGELFITGRLKDIVIVGGENYYPQDAEAAARDAHGALANQVCAAWQVDAEDVARVSIALETDERDDAVLHEVVRAAAIAVARVVPAAVEALAVPRGKLPRTTSGKVRRSECARKAAADELPVLRRWSTR